MCRCVCPTFFSLCELDADDYFACFVMDRFLPWYWVVYIVLYILLHIPIGIYFPCVKTSIYVDC